MPGDLTEIRDRWAGATADGSLSTRMSGCSDDTDLEYRGVGKWTLATVYGGDEVNAPWVHRFVHAADDVRTLLDEIARLTAERDNDARILAALRALPPETVADVRAMAEAELWVARTVPNAAVANRATATRLTALADLLDAAREVPDAS